MVDPASDIKQLSTKVLIFRDQESFGSFGMAVAESGHSIMHDLFVMSVLFRSAATDERSGRVLKAVAAAKNKTGFRDREILTTF